MRALTCFLLAAASAAAPLWAASEAGPEYPMGAAVARQWMAAENRDRVLAALNSEWQQHGLGPLRCEPRLQDPAQSHADHLARHGLVGHAQQPNLEGFSGRRPLDRALAAGYAAPRGNEVAELYVVGLADAQAALAQRLSGPYHRHHLLWAEAGEGGIGLSRQPGLVLSLGVSRQGSAPSPEWVLWSPPSSREAPPLACCERARPAGLEEVVSPVSLQAWPGERLAIRKFEPINAAGRVVDTRLLTTASNEHLRLAPHVAYLVPLQPLQGGQQYRLDIDAQAGDGPLQRHSHFETSSLP